MINKDVDNSYWATYDLRGLYRDLRMSNVIGHKLALSLTPNLIKRNDHGRANSARALYSWYVLVAS